MSLEGAKYNGSGSYQLTWKCLIVLNSNIEYNSHSLHFQSIKGKALTTHFRMFRHYIPIVPNYPQKTFSTSTINIVKSVWAQYGLQGCLLFPFRSCKKYKYPPNILIPKALVLITVKVGTKGNELHFWRKKNTITLGGTEHTSIQIICYY